MQRRKEKELEDQLKDQNSEVISLAHEFSKLADQAQQLNLADKQPKQLEEKGEEVSPEVSEKKQETKESKGLTFQEMLNRIDEELLEKKSKAKVKLEQAKQIFQKIKAELGTTSDYEAIEFIKYMNENKYSLYK